MHPGSRFLFIFPFCVYSRPSSSAFWMHPLLQRHRGQYEQRRQQIRSPRYDGWRSTATRSAHFQRWAGDARAQDLSSPPYQARHAIMIIAPAAAASTAAAPAVIDCFSLRAERFWMASFSIRCFSASSRNVSTARLGLFPRKAHKKKSPPRDASPTLADQHADRAKSVATRRAQAYTMSTHDDAAQSPLLLRSRAATQRAAPIKPAYATTKLCARLSVWRMRSSRLCWRLITLSTANLSKSLSLKSVPEVTCSSQSSAWAVC